QQHVREAEHLRSLAGGPLRGPQGPGGDLAGNSTLPPARGEGREGGTTSRSSRSAPTPTLPQSGGREGVRPSAPAGHANAPPPPAATPCPKRGGPPGAAARPSGRAAPPRPPAATRP